MKLLSMRTENFLKCVFAEVNFESDRVEITGKNENGKSSFAKSIWALFGGKDAIPAAPVTEGAEQAVLRAELDGDFVITRTILPNRETKLELRNKDGGKYKSPQDILDGFNLRFGFWPERFILAEEKEQAAILRRTVPELDFTRDEMKVASIEQERTGVGRELKQLQGQLAGLRKHEDAPAAETSAASVLERLKAARALTAEYDKYYSAMLAEESQMDLKQREIERLKKQIVELQQSIENHSERAEEFHLKAEEIKAIEPTAAAAAIELELEQLEGVNAKVRDNAEHAKVGAAVQAKAASYDELTAQIEALRSKKTQALLSAKFPVPGLGFDENGVMFNGKPFSQTSTARKWEIAIAIGFALNPQLKLVYIEYGSLLDEDTLARVEKLVQENGGQLLLETVGDSETAVVLFEEGVAHFRDPATGKWFAGLDLAHPTIEENNEARVAVQELRREAAE